MNHIPCAFVNDEHPVKFGRNRGYKVHCNENELKLCAMREVFYQHPDAQQEALLVVVEEEVICRAKEGDLNYSALNLLFMAQENVSKLERL